MNEATETIGAGNFVTLDRLLSLEEVMTISHLSRASIYRLMKRSEFPRNMRLSPGRRAWKASDVNRWMLSLRHEGIKR